MLLTGFVYSLTHGSLPSDNVSVFHCVYFPPLLFGSGYEASIFFTAFHVFSTFFERDFAIPCQETVSRVYDVLTNFSLTALGIRSWQFY